MEHKRKYNIGDTVVYKRGELTGKAKVIETVLVELAGKEAVPYYVLDYHPNGEVFKESELSSI